MGTRNLTNGDYIMNHRSFLKTLVGLLVGTAAFSPVATAGPAKKPGKKPGGKQGKRQALRELARARAHVRRSNLKTQNKAAALLNINQAIFNVRHG
jgi:hypothetical protein